MALGTTNFDELNSLVGYKRSTPYEEYFGEMELSKVQKQDRIDLAEMFEEEFAEELEYLFYAYPNVREEDIDDLKDRYLGVLEAAGLIAMLGAVSKPQEQRFYDRADVFAAETIASTAANRDTLYTYSNDRAIFMAENEANLIFGAEDFWEAVEDGATEKTWITEGDNKVRGSHSEVDGLTIPIMEPFLVGGSFMMHPLDDSMGAGAEELVNCRCSIEYGGYVDVSQTEDVQEQFESNSGALSGAYNNDNDPDGRIREEIAEEQYEQIRNRDREYEIDAVSKNSRFTRDDVDRIFAHVFEREHLFEDGTIKKFDPDYYMVHSWKRLRDGKNIQKHDIIMLHHELNEEKIMGESLEIPYEKAHNEVEKTWNYKAALEEYLKEHDV